MDGDVYSGSRKSAGSLGFTLYFTGKKCSRGNVAKRSVKSGKCLCDKCVEYRAFSRQAYDADRYAKNSAEIKARVSANKKKNAEHYRAYMRQFYRENKHIFKRGRAKRRAAVLNSIPSWYGEFYDFVTTECFVHAGDMEQSFGFKFHVDHAIPIQAKEASGLNCASNLQVIPAVLNVTKRNRMIFTEPLSWIMAINEGRL